MNIVKFVGELENGIIKSKGAERFLNIAICDDNETDIKYIGKILIIQLNLAAFELTEI